MTLIAGAVFLPCSICTNKINCAYGSPNPFLWKTCRMRPNWAYGAALAMTTLRIGSVKGFADGALGPHTAAMFAAI